MSVKRGVGGNVAVETVSWGARSRSDDGNEKEQ